MDHELQTGKNFAWSAVAQFIVRLAGLALFVSMSYWLKEGGMGKYNFAFSFTTFWFIIVDFGAVGHLLREWAKHKKEFKEVEDDFFAVFTMRLIMSAVIFVPFLVVNYFINRDLFLVLILAFVSLLFALLASLFDVYFVSTSQFRYSSTRQVIERVSMVLFGLILLFFWRRVEVVFVAYIGSQLLSLAYYYFYAPINIKIRFVVDWNRYKFLFFKGIPFLFITIVTNIYNRIDMVMLKYMSSYESVGWYGMAYKFLEISFIFSAVLLMPAVFPVMTSLYHKEGGQEEFNKYFYKIFRILFSSGLVITLFFIFYSPAIIIGFFPSSFSQSILALRILIFTLVLGSISVLFNNQLYIQNKEKMALYIVAFGALLNVALNFALIPRYSLYGSAWATVISEFFNLLLLQHFVSWKKDYNVLFKMTAVCLVNLAIFMAMKLNGQMNNYFLGTLVFVVNLAVLYKIKLVEIEDIKLFLRPFKLKLASLRQ